MNKSTCCCLQVFYLQKLEKNIIFLLSFCIGLASKLGEGKKSAVHFWLYRMKSGFEIGNDGTETDVQAGSRFSLALSFTLAQL